MKDKVWKYLHQRVVVRALGIEYTGIFKGADEDWVYLQCETTWVQIPWLEITSFKPSEMGEEARIYRPIEGEPEPNGEERRKKRARNFEQELRLIRGGKEQSGESELNSEDKESSGED